MPMRWRSGMACNFGRAFCATSKPGSCKRATLLLTRTTIGGSRPAPVDSAAAWVPHDHQPDRDAGLPQSLRLLLSRHRWIADAVPHAGSRNRLRTNLLRTASLTPCSSTTILGRDATISARLCAALRPLKKIWSAAVTIDVTDDPSLIRNMALAGCTGVFIGFESLSDDNLSDAHKKTPKTADYARRVRMLHDVRDSGEWIVSCWDSIMIGKTYSRARRNGSRRIVWSALPFTS